MPSTCTRPFPSPPCSLGKALFGVGGALVAVPVAALGLAVFQIYSRTFELLPELGAPGPAVPR
jgi:hypothetical protein